MPLQPSERCPIVSIASMQTWHEFELPWKPGRVDRLPPVLPLGHMPRLDWRLWFLPLRRGYENRTRVSLCSGGLLF